MTYEFSRALAEEVRVEITRRRGTDQQTTERQVALAASEASGLSLSTIGRSIRGARDWEADALYAVAEVLAVPLPELIRRAQDTKQRWEAQAAADSRCTQPLGSLDMSSLVSAPPMAVA